MTAAQLAGVSRETAERRRPGRPPKPRPIVKRPRRTYGTGSISVLTSGRVFALDVRDSDGHRASYDGVGADVDARYADCERWLGERIAARKRLAGQAPLTVRDHLEQWHWRTHRLLELPTRNTYRSQIKQAEPIGDLLVTAVTPEDIDGITSSMLDTGLSVRYVRETRARLRSAFAELVPKMLAANPVGKYAGRLRTPRRRPNVWDAVDAEDFAGVALKVSRWPLMWLLALRYGLRRGELRALRRQDLNVRTRRLTVAHGMHAGRRLADTKNHQERSIQIARPIVAALEAMLAAADPSVGWLFHLEAGEAIPPNPFYADFDAIVAQVNKERYERAIEGELSEAAARQTALPTLTPHGLRHTAATLLLRRGVAVAKVAEILGHHDPSFTYRLYGWAVPSDDDVVDGAVGSLLTPAEQLLAGSERSAAHRQQAER